MLPWDCSERGREERKRGSEEARKRGREEERKRGREEERKRGEGGGNPGREAAGIAQQGPPQVTIPREFDPQRTDRIPDIIPVTEGKGRREAESEGEGTGERRRLEAAPLKAAGRPEAAGRP